MIAEPESNLNEENKEESNVATTNNEANEIDTDDLGRPRSPPQVSI